MQVCGWKNINCPEEAAGKHPDWTQDSLHVGILHEAALGNLNLGALINY